MRPGPTLRGRWWAEEEIRKIQNQNPSLRNCCSCSQATARAQQPLDMGPGPGSGTSQRPLFGLGNKNQELVMENFGVL